MTIQEAIEKLEKQVEHINITIDYLRALDTTFEKKKKIVKSVKKIHHTQTSEGRRKQSLKMKKYWRERKAIAKEHIRRNNS